MDTMTERLNKLREERLAREKARIEKLRELNLKKYSTPSEAPKNSTVCNLSLIKKSVKSEINVKTNTNYVKGNLHVTKRPVSAPLSKPLIKDIKSKNSTKENISTINENIIANNSNEKVTKNSKIVSNMSERKPLIATVDKKVMGPSKKLFESKTMPAKQTSITNPVINKKPNNVTMPKKTSIPNMTRKSYAVTEKQKTNIPRKSLAPPSTSKPSLSNNSVFERLYKPKQQQQQHATDIKKLQTDPNYLKKVIRTTGLILNKRHTVFDVKPKIDVPVRRSISAVHFKRIGQDQLSSCIQSWSSIGEKLNKVHLKNINEDENVKQDRVVSAIKSERKKVKFMSPMTNLNTPRPEELQARLKSWLQKRGKSLDSYHHLQCFGIHHLPHNLRFDPKLYDDENKENVAVDSDSDNDSYTENMTGDVEKVNDNTENANNKWRRASIVSDSNETLNTTTTCSDVINTDEVLIGALNDLTELLREGFEWEQCARWLRALRERFPSAPHCAAYWECRAALEETRGDLPASVQCWEEAIAKGTQHSVVEANLDQLLDKFMQLKISPNSGKSRKQVDPKLVDVKNVFKSTIIRFAVQQAKLRQSNQFSPAAKFCVTPVRRSARLSIHWSGKRTPLQVCSSVRQADEIVGEKLLFVPNENLNGTP